MPPRDKETLLRIAHFKLDYAITQLRAMTILGCADDPVAQTEIGALVEDALLELEMAAPAQGEQLLAEKKAKSGRLRVMEVG